MMQRTWRLSAVSARHLTTHTNATHTHTTHTHTHTHQQQQKQQQQQQQHTHTHIHIYIYIHIYINTPVYIYLNTGRQMCVIARYGLMARPGMRTRRPCTRPCAFAQHADVSAHLCACTHVRHTPCFFRLPKLNLNLLEPRPSAVNFCIFLSGFQSFTYWNHDLPPSSLDEVPQLMEWTQVFFLIDLVWRARAQARWRSCRPSFLLSAALNP